MDRLTRLRDYVEHDPGNDVLLLELIDELLARGHIAEAAATLANVPEAARNRPEFVWRSARLALSSGVFAAAIIALEGLLQVGVDTAAIRHDLAFALLCDQQPARAETMLAPVLDQAAELPAIGILQARLLQHRGALDDALVLVEAVVAAQPEQAEAWGLLSLLQVDRVEIEPARHAAETALRLMPQQSDACIAMGTLALWAHDAKAASAAFNEVLSLQPRAGRALAGAGEALLLGGDVAAAQAFLLRAVQYMPGHIGTWHALAWCHLLQREVAQAHGCFDKALVLDRNFGETHGGLALVHALEGHSEEAHQAARRALRLDPQSRNARYAQSLLCSRTHDAEVLVDGILAEAGVNPAGRPTQFIERLRAQLTPNGDA